MRALSLEAEKAYRPSVVRPLRIGGEVVGSGIVGDVVVYFTFFFLIAVIAWLLLLAVEPDTTWVKEGADVHEKLMDCASGVAATINGVGPGLGTIGATRNYAHFKPLSKLIFSALMLLGRLEILPILVLLAPAFWRSR